MGAGAFVLTIHFFAVGDLTIHSDGTAFIESAYHSCAGLRLSKSERLGILDELLWSSVDSWKSSYPDGSAASSETDAVDREWLKLSINEEPAVVVQWTHPEQLPDDLKRLQALAFHIGLRLKNECVRRTMGFPLLRSYPMFKKDLLPEDFLIIEPSRRP